jgi:hypothetical protein
MSGIFSSAQNDDQPIIRPPNRIIKFIEITKWYWPVIFFASSLLFYLIVNPTTDQSNIPVTTEATLGLLLIFLNFVFIPFYAGVKLGARIYKPQESYISPKQIRSFNELLGKGKTITISIGEKKKVEIESEKEKEEKES